MAIPTIAQLVRQHAQRVPDGVALRWPERDFDRADPAWRTVTWSDLDLHSDGLARGLRSRGIAPSARVAVFLRPGPEWLALVLACWKLGAAAVVTDRRLPLREMVGALRRTRPRGLVATAWLHRLRPLFGDAFASVDVAVAPGAPWLWNGVRLSDLGVEGESVAPLPSDADALAVVELSRPERELSHAQLLARTPFVEEPDEPPTTVETSWARVFVHLAAGRPTVWAPLDPGARPADDWALALSHHSDARLAVGGQRVFERPPPDVAGLTRAVAVGLFAGAWMEAWTRALGGPQALSAVWYTPATGPVARIGAREVRSETLDKTLRGAGLCVGRPVDGVRVDIVGITEGPVVDLDAARLPARGIGEIVVTGPGVVVEYPDDAEHQDHVVVDERWVRTGWLGYLDEDGRLWIAGPMGDRIESAAGLVTPLTVEGLFQGDPDVVRCALVGVGPRGSAVPVMLVQLRAGKALGPQMEARWRAREADTPVRGVVRRYLEHPGISVTSSGDVDRTALRPWAEQRCTDLVRAEDV